MNIKISGIIDSWEVINIDGSISSSCHIPQKNVITNNGLNLFIPSGSDYDTAYRDCIKYFVIGTGTSTPSVTDTTLENEEYRGSCEYVSFDEDIVPSIGDYPYTHIIQRGVETPLGELDDIYTEIGFSNSGISNDPVFSRLRLRDVNGDNISLPISSTQQLRLKYKLYFTIEPSLPDYYTDSYDSYTAGWQNVADIKKVIYLLTGVTPSGSINIGIKDDSWVWSQTGSDVSFNSGNYYNTTLTIEDYVNNSYCRYYNVTIGVDDALFEWKTLNLYYNINDEDDAMWIMCYDTPLPRLTTHRTTLRFKVSWSN